ncbi:MAG: transposase [Ardenticatenia bacterium]|nr:transposase [Ardenticatenia bacterium]
MFRKNTRHWQPPLTSHVDELPEPLRKRLQNSWAETFYRESFCRLDEEPFGVLYADRPSRPNVPVNVVVGLEFLKAAHGWSDEEMDNQFCYNVQVRYALEYRHLGEGYFDLRTLYNFRQRLARHVQETGENLLEQAFEQVTDEQLEAFALKTGQQRMDSTMPASNIRQMGRVQLLVTVLQRVHRMLSEADRERYADLLAPYLKGHPGQYVYRLKKDEVPDHLRRIGEVIQQLLRALEADYGQEPTYRVLARVFGDHFRQEPERLVVKEGSELSADSLQSPDDLEATYREKRGQGYRGYVVNVTETCDPENPAPLITKVQVAPNVTDDSTLLSEAVPALKERTGLETLYTDGGYGSPENDTWLEEEGVTLIQTAIRGRRRDPERLYLDDFQVEREPGANRSGWSVLERLPPR